MQVDHTEGKLTFLNHHGEESEYDILQFHLHAPSEHTIDGKYFDLELHIVHQLPNSDQLAVVGIFFDRMAGGEAENPFIESLQVDRLSSEEAVRVREIPLRQLAQQMSTSKIYNYEGSLTTPGCAETVNWIVLDDPQPISTRQLEAFQSLWSNNSAFAGGKGNNRVTMPLNGRKIFFKNDHRTAFLQ